MSANKKIKLRLHHEKWKDRSIVKDKDKDFLKFSKILPWTLIYVLFDSLIYFIKY